MSKLMSTMQFMSEWMPVPAAQQNPDVELAQKRARLLARRQRKLEAIEAVYRCTDAGRKAAGFLRERRDCTVRATAVALDIPYAEAHAKMKALGRRDCRGVPYEAYISGLGMQRVADWKPRTTLYKALGSLKSGRYVARMRGHVFAVVDGIVHDTATPRPGSRILAVYRKAG